MEPEDQPGEAAVVWFRDFLKRKNKKKKKKRKNRVLRENIARKYCLFVCCRTEGRVGGVGEGCQERPI